MPERTDRRIGNSPLLLAAVAVLLALVVGGAIALWLRMSASDAVPTKTAGGQAPLSQIIRRDEPLMVMICYPADGLLDCRSAAVKRQPDIQSQVRDVLVALLGDPRAGESAGLRDVRLKALYVDVSGKVFVDLTSPQQKEIRASAWEELLAIYSVVNTVMQNFEEIKQVRFLREGKETQTLAGHMDLSRTFTKRMDLVKQ